MKQTSFFTHIYDNKKKKVRKEIFLGEMEKVVPWKNLKELIEPHYPKAGNGRKPMPLDWMLRIYFCQKWFNLSDPGMEDAIYDVISIQRFIGIDMSSNSIPDESTILQFRHLLEDHQLTEALFHCINDKLALHGLLVKTGTIVDATIINAPPSTKNKERKRDPEMHQTRKGNQWYFGMKIHTGSDTGQGLVHTLKGTAANVADNTVMDDLLQGDEIEVYGDKAYADELAQDISEALGVEWKVQHKAKPGNVLTAKQERENAKRSRVRAKGEHAYRIVKDVWGHAKVRYRFIGIILSDSIFCMAKRIIFCDKYYFLNLIRASLSKCHSGKTP